MRIIYFADDYKGGANNFLEQNIKYNLRNKKKVIVFNKNFLKTFPNIKKDKNLSFFNLDVFDKKNEIKKLVKNFKSDKNLFFFTNYAVLVYYFFLFIDLEKRNNKFAIALHSGIFKLSVKTILGLILFSIFALKLDHIIFGSHSSKQWWLSLFPWLKIVDNRIIFNGVDKQNRKKKIRKL